MAKKGQIERNEKRRRLAKKYAARRAKLKVLARDKKLSQEERFSARLKLAQLPRNSSPDRYRLRCELTGRSRGNYQKFKLCRMKIRELGSSGQIPGLVKSSW